MNKKQIKMKNHLSIILMVLFFITLHSCKENAKQESQKNSIPESEITNIKLQKALQGLYKYTFKEESAKLDIEAIALYLENGELITDKMKKFELLTSGNYNPVIYANKEEQVKVMVLKELSKEEKEKNNKKTIEKSTIVGKPAIDFSLTDINGNSHNLEDLKGKIVVLNFWFTTCPPCIVEIPKLNELVKKYENEKDLVFIGISTDDKERTQAFLKKKPFNYTIVANNGKIGIVNDYDINTFPTNIIINKKSEIIFWEAGFSSNTINSIHQKIEEELAAVY